MANLLLNKWQLSRRAVLRGLGATIALPMLECMAAAASPMSKPKRSVFLDRKSTRLNSSHVSESRMPSSA